MSDPEFKFVEGGKKLIVQVDLDQYAAERFEQACEKLWGAYGEKVSIDLSGISYICSTCLGQLVVTKDRCDEEKKRLDLRISRKLMDIFDLLSIRDLISTEVVD